MLIASDLGSSQEALPLPDSSRRSETCHSLMVPPNVTELGVRAYPMDLAFSPLEGKHQLNKVQSKQFSLSYLCSSAVGRWRLVQVPLLHCPAINCMCHELGCGGEKSSFEAGNVPMVPTVQVPCCELRNVCVAFHLENEMVSLDANDPCNLPLPPSEEESRGLSSYTGSEETLSPVPQRAKGPMQVV